MYALFYIYLFLFVISYVLLVVCRYGNLEDDPFFRDVVLYETTNNPINKFGDAVSSAMESEKSRKNKKFVDHILEADKRRRGASFNYIGAIVILLFWWILLPIAFFRTSKSNKK